MMNRFFEGRFEIRFRLVSGVGAHNCRFDDFVSSPLNFDAGMDKVTCAIHLSISHILDGAEY